MKPKFLIVLLLPFVGLAQESLLDAKKNELRLDVLSVVAAGKFGFSYERFIGGDFSVGVNANFSNSSRVREDFESGSRNNLPKYEFNPYVRYALSKSRKSYYFAEVFASANGGDFKSIVVQTDLAGNDYYTIDISKYTDVGLGGSLGYKMYIKDAWAIEFLAGFGSNLTTRDKSPDVISRIGINLGYRF